MAFVLLGSGLGGLRCRKVWRVLAALAVVVGFSYAIQEGQRLVDAGRADPALAMWAPAVVLVLGTLAVRRAARMPALVAS
jgi:lipopolysaccharide export LptBFGC system permease protein LptF